MNSQISRRSFLKTSAVAASALAAPNLIPASAFGANNKVVMGCIGLGVMGMGDMGAFRGNTEDVRVVAVCDVHENQRNRGKQAVDEFYNNKDCTAYKDFRELM